MARTNPSRTVQVRDVTLDEYDGNLSDILRGILQECRCETHIPVKKYAYYEGRVFQKYKVGITLPAKLGMSVIMLAGEAHRVSVAYKIAVMKAITDNCEHKMEKLLGTKFMHIPHDEEGEDPRRDSYKFAKRNPHAAAEHMDWCKHLLSVFYHVHGALVGEIQSLVEEITESTPTPWCTGETSGPPRAPTPAFSTRDFINLDEEVNPEEREFEPEAESEMPPAHFAHGSTRVGYEVGIESWIMPHNDSFGGDSMGWRFGEYMGIAGDPIPCDSEQEVMSQFRVVHHGGDVEGKPIEIGSDLEGEMPIHMEHGECSTPKMERGATDSAYPSLSNYLGMTDFNLATTPDLSYSPAESSYVPTSLRGTLRATGSTPRMYRECDYP
jgi:hypothetical protein